MASFHVNPNAMRYSSAQILQISSRIRQICLQLEDFMNQDYLHTSSYESVRRSLRTMADSSSDLSIKIRCLSNALDEITSVYEQTERHLSSQTSAEHPVHSSSPSASAVSDASTDDSRQTLDAIRADIRKLSVLPGIDPAAIYSADPVNLSNGNYVYEKSFFNFDTLIPFRLRIFYNARSSFSGDLGTGWMHCFERRLLHQENMYRVLNEDGSVHIFRLESGVFSPLTGTEVSLSREENGFLFTDEEKNAFRFDESGRYLSAQTPDGWRLELLYNGNRLNAVQCSDNLSLHFLFHDDGTLEKVSDHTGRSVEFFWDNGMLSAVRDPGGGITNYRYDDAGRLCTVLAPNGDLSVENVFDENGRTVRQIFADGGEVLYRYEDAQKAVFMRRQNGSEVAYYHDSLFRNTRTVYPDGTETIGYNENSQRVSFEDKLGRISRYRYDTAGRLTEFINAAGNRVSFSYNEAGQLQQTFLDDEQMDQSEYDEHGHQIIHTNANGEKTRFSYDSFGRVTEIIHEDGSKTCLTYDSCGNISSVEDPLTGHTQYEYDGCARVIRSVDALGNETRYEYDALDHIVRVINAEGFHRTFQYDLRGNLVRVEDFNGGVTQIAYNSMNRPVRITDPDGNVTAFEYDLMSKPVRKVMPDGGIYEYTYDAESRMTGIRHPMGGQETAEYDAVGNLIRRCAADGGEYRIAYDTLNRPVSVTDPVQGLRKAGYDCMGNVTAIYYEDGTEEQFSYDRMGNCISHTDRTGYVRTFQYNALGKLVRVQDKDGILAQYFYAPGGLLVREERMDGQSLSYAYDPAGNVIEVRDSVRGAWHFSYDTMGRMCRAEHDGEGSQLYEYDAIGNLTAVTDGAGNKTVFHYTPAGALEKVIDALGTETLYRYDPCYRLKQILQPADGIFTSDAPGTFIRTTTYERDLNGNVVSVLDNTGSSIRYGYDACGRIISRQDPEGNLIRCSYHPDGTEDILTFSDGRSIKYQYDALKRLEQIEDWIGLTRITRDPVGRIESVTDPLGNHVDYEWNGRGQCTKICYPDGTPVTYEYDAAMRLSRCSGAGAEMQYDYYDNGQLRERRFSDGFSTHYVYDTAGRIERMSNCRGETILERYVYTYDPCSRKNRMVHQKETTTETDISFSYDPLGQLCGVTRNGQQAESYGYDRFGNRTRMVTRDTCVTFGYNSSGQLIWSKSPGEERQYRYDGRGNLTGESVNGIEQLSLHFDALNRLAYAVSGRGRAEYTYNGLGMLSHISAQMNGETWEQGLFFDYAGQENHLIALRNNQEWKNLVWDHEPALSLSARGNAVYLNDERMSLCGVWKNGQSEHREYDAFGVCAADFSFGEPFAFAGSRYDEITGFYDCGWRQYDARTGRFISQDPVAGSICQPVTLNPYPYCISDPINCVDPTGMIVAWLAGGIVGAIANAGVKLAGDVIDSVENGKWTFSSWESYVGAAAGGFVQGSVFTVAGPVAAGAAGAATESFITNGLNMAFHEEGYRKEDGYGVGKLLVDTGISGTKGAATGFAFNWTANYIKIPGITQGRGSFISVWKQVMTKAQRGLISNVTWKTMMKGLMGYGLIRSLDTMLVKGKEAIEDYLKKDIPAMMWERISQSADSGNGSSSGFRELISERRTAACSTA